MKIKRWVMGFLVAGNPQRRLLSRLVSDRGFTGLELMVAIAIIAIISAIHIPNLLRERAGANEASTCGALRTLVSSREMFYQGDTGSGTCEYATGLGTLCPDGLCPFIDAVLGTGEKDGYGFEVESLDFDRWRVIASPACSTCGLATYSVDPYGRITKEICGNGLVEGTEQCEPGALATSQVCSSTERCGADCRCRSVKPLDDTAVVGAAGESYSSFAAKSLATEAQLKSKALSLLGVLNAASKCRVVKGAQKLLSDPATARILVKALDANGDGQLGWSELSVSAILRATKQAAAKIGRPGPELKTDVDFLGALSRYNQAVEKLVQPGIANEGALPSVPFQDSPTQPAVQFLELLSGVTSTISN